MNTPNGFNIGDRVRLTADVDRYPHCIVRKGDCGTITQSDECNISVTLDRVYPDLAEWNNALRWDDEQLEDYSYQIEPLFAFNII